MKLASKLGVAMTSTQTLKQRLDTLAGDDDFRVVHIFADAPTEAERQVQIDEKLAAMGLSRDHHPGVLLFLVHYQSKEEALGGYNS